ncbi:ABC transporter ATP-binding protein [Geoalkalibacter subterraneus]|uniref:ABC transporter domain-containing protein n=1 Tax=Geoalkalibacter subterraneus TaxID=483547 RepID=A0A0B5FQX1_9BACT|nr:ABC transporter ATP-binding protein [Geoalkalibacter subterraneus]AJF06505.1 hypothetical protein GSUB_08035 [Geoalkalibacter subterraneus]
MSDVAIKVENLHKLYRLGLKDDENDTLIQTALSWITAPKKNFTNLRKLTTMDLNSTDDPDVLHALNDISFEVKHGEVLGIIGRNGAGKSTLLKVLSRITEPTAGRVTINGRVASLLEVGTGFHPELTGRENIYMNGTILGMSKKEIDRKFDEIVDFSGVERFLDTPVKRYSSGMKVRLAFSVAAHLDPEILIIDEVLAVGDVDFQKKCLGKMQDVSSGGRTVLFVSHNMGAIQTLCPRSLLLRQGQMVDDGESDQVVRSYLSRMKKNRSEIFTLDNADRTNTGVLRLTDAFVLDNDGQETENIIAGEDITFKFSYESNQDLSNLTIIFTVLDDVGKPVTHIRSDLKGTVFKSPSRRGVFNCSVPQNPFAIGDYRVAVAVFADDVQLDHISAAIHFAVVDSIYFGSAKVPPRQYCTVYVDHSWTLENV